MAALVWQSARRPPAERPGPPGVRGVRESPRRPAGPERSRAAPASPSPRSAAARASSIEIAPAPAGGAPRLAIVIDDLGNDTQALDELLSVSEPWTGSVLPELPASVATARRLERAGREVLLHLPLEPIGSANPGPGLIRTTMTAAQVAAQFSEDLASVPGASGVNNHMGSKGTANWPLMRLLMQELARRGLFYLDSRTSDRSVGLAAARQEGVPAAARDVFLDDVATEPAVAKQLALAAEEARRRGSAVAIGHPHPATIAVLARELPLMQSRGIRLVPVSRLLTGAAR